MPRPSRSLEPLADDLPEQSQASLPGIWHLDPGAANQYGNAGIEHYWRVETAPDLVVHTFRLGDDATYVATGLFKAGDLVNAPGLSWAQVPVDEVLG